MPRVSRLLKGGGQHEMNSFVIIFVTVCFYFPLLFRCFDEFAWVESSEPTLKATTCQRPPRRRILSPWNTVAWFLNYLNPFDRYLQCKAKHLKRIEKKFSSNPIECEDMIGSDAPHSPSDESQPSSIPPSPPLTGSDDGSVNGEIKKETFTFPKTLKDFKYEFNEEGQLRHVETNNPFEFNVGDNAVYNQQHYEALGEIITEYVYDLLEKAGLKKVYIPIDSNDSEPQSFIFLTKDALENEDKLLLLVHGSGVVKAGQWARRLIINDCLDSGSQLPFIKKAIEDGYGVLVLNTNYNTVDGQKIRENGTPTQHMLYIWKHFVQKARAKHIAFVSHSYGGVVTVKAACENQDFQSRVFAVAFTDSIHSDYVTDDLEKFFQEKSRNWVSSDDPLDTEIPSHFCSTPKVSAGHSQHEMTSFSSINSIFSFLKQKYEEITKSQAM